MLEWMLPTTFLALLSEFRPIFTVPSFANFEVLVCLRQGGKPFQSYGHVFVVLAVHIRVPLLSDTGWALPFMFRLFEGPRVGGRADSPSDQRRAHHRKRKKLSKRARVRKTDRKVARGKVGACPARKGHRAAARRSSSDEAFNSPRRCS
jgi:hypothetical protein